MFGKLRAYRRLRRLRRYQRWYRRTLETTIEQKRRIWRLV